ncbi:MAG: hypothetical protein WCL06_12755, partial [Bacteroidota bacterium]
MKRMLLVLIALAISSLSFAQLSGTKYIPGSGGPNDYPTIAAAVTALNSAGVGAGGVTFDVASGYTETITAAISLTATGTAANPIVFHKVGATANPLITAYTTGTGTPGTAVQDGMWNLIGSDYVTIDGIDLTDPNAANPATMEYGYGLFKASVSDGCQYNTIKNCVVTLNRINNASGTAPAFDGSRGIVVVNALVSAHTTALTPTSAAGTNSYNQFYTNTIQNCNIGIAINGYAASSPFTLGDFGNDIGGSSSATGNIIINFGGAAAATNPAAGIRVNNQWGINISYNTINNNNGSGVNHVSTLRGIYAQAGTSASANINYNNVTIKGGGTTSSIYAIDNGIGSTPASNTVNINNNTITGTYTTATSGVFYGINNTGYPAFLNINYNTISGISTPGTGTLYCTYNSGATSTTTLTLSNNNISNITKTGIGTINAFYVTGSPSVYLQSNTVDGLSCTAAASTSTINGYTNSSSSVIESFIGNIFKNFSSTGTATIKGVYIGTATGNKTFQNNQFYNFSTSGGGSLYGIHMAYGAVDEISNNQVYNLNSTGGTAGTTYGIYVTAGTTNSIFKNNIYNLSAGSAGCAVYGLYIGGGTTNNIYNNYVSDLKAPALNAAISLAGIYLSSGTTDNVFFNTVFLSGTSSGALFGSAALYASTTPTVDLRNNILVNATTPVGATGFAAAYRRTSTTLTSYSANSNGNCFYAGTPGTYNLIMYDGTNSYQTMAAYQTAVGARDGASFSVMPPFINAAVAPFNLHLTAGATTLCESGGVQITSPIAITDDFDGNTRTSTPDVGADEFNGVAAGAGASLALACDLVI